MHHEVVWKAQTFFFATNAVAVYPRKAYGDKERTSPDCLKIRKNCIKILDFSMYIYIIMLHSYINAFTCSWYVSNTYHSPVNVYVTATYCIRSTLVYWSRLGWNCYGTDTYLPSSYSRSEYLFRTRSIDTDLVTSLELQRICWANMLCHFGQTRNGYIATYFILLSSTAAINATSGYVIDPEQLGQNEEPVGSNKELAKKKPRFVPKVDLIDAIVFPSIWLWFYSIILVCFT